MRICIVSPALPPKLDGIGDYTANLAAELAKTEEVKILTAQGMSATPIAGVTAIQEVFTVSQPESVRRLLPIIQGDAPDWVLLQYNPFSYGRWGRNLHLPEVMRRIKRLPNRPKFALMMHEPFVPINTPQFAVMATWQRWQLWELGRTADVMFCSIDPWKRRFSRWFPRTAVHHLPVGSNIPHVPISRDEARTRLGIPDQTIVLGLFGTVHQSRMLDWVQGAAQAVRSQGRDVLVLYMGPHGKAICETLVGIPIIAEGPLSAEEVSRRFAAVDIALAPFIDGVSTRRTSFMTAIQHGISTVATDGELTDSLLSAEDGKALLLANVASPDAFYAHVVRLAENAPLRSQLGQAAQSLYEREFAWPTIAGRVLQEMPESSLAVGASLRGDTSDQENC